jgi:hypothetical protein
MPAPVQPARAVTAVTHQATRHHLLLSHPLARRPAAVQMQSYGQPPDDIVSEMHKQIGQDLPGLGEEGPGGLPAGLEGLLGGGPGGLAGLGGPGGDLDPEKCCIM